MNEKKFLQKMEEIMDIDPDTLHVEDVLDEYDEWDSLSALGLIMYCKNDLAKSLDTATLRSFVTVQDVYDFCKG